MDFWIDMGITALLRILQDRKKAAPYFKAIAKVYVKVEVMAEMDQQLAVEIEHQRKRQGVA